MKKLYKELLHYAVVFAVILLAWVPVMDYFNDDIYLTSGAVFLIFILADQLAHKILLKEKTLWE